MRWVKIAVRTNVAALEAVTAALEALGTGGTVFEDGPVAAGYLPADDRFETSLNSLTEALERMPEAGVDPSPSDVTLTFVEDADWENAWKAHYTPVPVSERLTITPSWDDYTGRPGEMVIRLDPGMAFGTGGHATTRLCLRALESLVRGGETAADVGTGSGVLAIGAVILGAAHVDAVDTDPVAAKIARKNIETNGVGDRIAVRVGDRLAGMLGPYDLVIANILPNVVSILAASAFQRLNPGGTYLVSGLTLPYEEDVTAALVDAGFTMEGRWEEDRWLALTGRKPADTA